MIKLTVPLRKPTVKSAGYTRKRYKEGICVNYKVGNNHINKNKRDMPDIKNGFKLSGTGNLPGFFCGPYGFEHYRNNFEKVAADAVIGYVENRRGI